MINILLIFIIFISIFMAALFSGAETGMYQLNLLRLRLGIERRKLSYILLGKLFDDSPSLLISTLLGTNLAQYIITSILTYMLVSHYGSEHIAEIFAAIIATPLLFIFSDLIPKNLFFHHADTLMPRISYVLFGVNKIFKWLQIVPLLRTLLKFFAGPAASAPFLRAHVNAVRFPYLKKIIYDIETQNLLSPVQTSIINRLSQIGNLTVSSVMTPLGKFQMIDISCDRTVMLKKIQDYPYAWWPVCDKQNENIIGFVNIFDFLNQQNPDAKLFDFIKPLEKLNSETTITEAIHIMQAKNQKMMLVMKKGHTNIDKPVGIVTMKDLAEELVGELSEW
jgi:putative hemolysin